MRFKSIIAGIVSALLVCGLVPAEALAEEVMQSQAESVLLKYRYTDAFDDVDEAEYPWMTFATREEAEQARRDQESYGETTPSHPFEDETNETVAGGEVVEEAPEQTARRFEAQLEGTSDAVEYRLAHVTESDEQSEDEDWTSEYVVVKQPTLLQMRLRGEIAQTQSVWYRVRTEHGWCDWVCDGERVGSEEATIEDIQAVLLPKQVTEDMSKEMVQEAAEEETEMPEPESEQDVQPNANVTEEDDSAVVVQDTTGEEAISQEKTPQLAVQAETPIPTIRYEAYLQKRGWKQAVTNGVVAGEASGGLRMEALRMRLLNTTEGGIQYRAYVQSSGWQDWKANGQTAGTTGKSLRVEAIRIKLTGTLSKTCDVWYRCFLQESGWQSWRKNGKMAGKTGKKKRIEAYQVVLLPKGAQSPAVAVNDPALGSDNKSKGTVTYCANASGVGSLGWVCDGEKAGMIVDGIHLDGFTAQLAGDKIANTDLHYRVYVAGEGWQGEVTGGTAAGRVGSGSRLLAFRMRLSGSAARLFDIYYRSYVAGLGWLNWAKNNARSGFLEEGSGMQAIQVRLVAKGSPAPALGKAKSYAYSRVPKLVYRGNVQTRGWQPWTYKGQTSGAPGESLQLEALRAKVKRAKLSGSIRLHSHVESIGWQKWAKQGKTSGTVGKNKWVDAIQARLTGDLAKQYDLYYRVYVHQLGWMGWAKNGDKAGTTWLSLPIEAVQMTMVKKGAEAPGSTDGSYIEGKNVGKLGYQNPAGFYQVSRFSVLPPYGASSPFDYVTRSRISVTATRKQCVNAFLQRAREYLGTPYVWNYACAPGVGVDCIGLVYQCAYACGMDLGRGTGDTDFNPWAHWITGSNGWHSHDANNFWNYGKAMHVPVSQKKAGDVLYWPGHVAIYMGSGKIIEAWTPQTGVISVRLSSRAAPTGCIRLFQ